MYIFCKVLRFNSLSITIKQQLSIEFESIDKSDSLLNLLKCTSYKAILDTCRLLSILNRSCYIDKNKI